MNSFFGIDPDAIASAKDIGLLFRAISSEHGRFIFDFPGKWRERVRARLADATEMELKRIDDWFSRGPVRATFQPPINKVSFDNGMSWERNASRLRADPLCLLGKPQATEPVRPLWEALDDPGGLPASGSAYVPLKKLPLAEAATPLLMVSTKVVLVDPYLKVAVPTKVGGWEPSSTGMPVLQELLRVAGRGRVEAFEVYASREKTGGLADDPTGEHAQKVLLRVLDALRLPRRIEIRCRALEDNGDLVKLDDHDRHLLGNHCGISSGRGFAEHGYNKTKLQWLQGQALQDLLDQFT